MYTLLILFFSSLFCIIIMIGRKLVMLRNGPSQSEIVLLEIPYLREIRHLTVKNAKKMGHVGLIMTLRVYIRSTNFLKNKYAEAKTKIKNKNAKRDSNGSSPEQAEASNFLKMISDYKHKIRTIKQKIHEEEKNS